MNFARILSEVNDPRDLKPVQTTRQSDVSIKRKKRPIFVEIKSIIFLNPF